MNRNEINQIDTRYYVANPDSGEVLVDTGHCRVQRHATFGVVISGGLECITLNDHVVMVPIRDSDIAEDGAP
jgi:hypothetical protein